MGLVVLVALSGAPQQSAGPATAGNPTVERSLPPMSTDRPDITDSTDVVGRGIWQVETGVSFQADLDEGISHHEVTMPQAMLRVGVSERLELRFSGDGVLSDSVALPDVAGRRTRVTGGSDLEVGAKWKLFERPRAGFVAALEPVFSLPIGSDDFTSGGYDPTLKVIVDRELPAGLALSANVVISRVTVEGRRFTQRAVSGSFARAVSGAWHGFAELYRASPLGDAGGAAWIGDLGAMRALGTRFQIDISVGRGFTAAAPRWFVGGGIAIRRVPGA
jgi:hypothetical protein